MLNQAVGVAEHVVNYPTQEVWAAGQEWRLSVAGPLPVEMVQHAAHRSARDQSVANQRVLEAFGVRDLG
eukprot:8184401-Pyramimonas_sp.AAC.1